MQEGDRLLDRQVFAPLIRVYFREVISVSGNPICLVIDKVANYPEFLLCLVGSGSAKQYNGIIKNDAAGLDCVGFYACLFVLATTVRRELGLHVRVLEPSLQGYSFQQVVDIAKDYTHVGISCYTESRFSSVDLAQAIKGADYNKVLIFVVPHVTSLGSSFLKEYPYIDFMIRYDGEKALLGILKGADSSALLGLVYRGTNGQIIENPIVRDKKVNCLDIDYDFIEDVIVERSFSLMRGCGKSLCRMTLST